MVAISWTLANRYGSVYEACRPADGILLARCGRALVSFHIFEPVTVVGTLSFHVSDLTLLSGRCPSCIPFQAALHRPRSVNMQLSFWTPLLVLTSVASAYTPESTLSTDFLAIASLAKLAGSVADGSLKKHLAQQGVSQDCNLLTVGVRRE